MIDHQALGVLMTVDALLRSVLERRIVLVGVLT